MRRRFRARLFQPYLLMTIIVAFTGATGSSGTSEKDLTRVAIKAQPFDLRQVRLLDGPFKDAMEVERHKIRRASLQSTTSGEISEMHYSIPSEWSQGKKKVNVVFRAVRGKSIGKLVACSIEKE